MATSNTIATQTEEEEEDYSHVTAKNIDFNCSEGIQARLDKFEVVSSKGFVLRVEIGGKLYSGFLIEAIDSFAPVKLTASKRRRPTFHSRSKPRHTGAPRTKKPNVYSRENFPQGYVDTYNTIEARLRYGRDKRIPSFNNSHAAENSSLQSKDGRNLKSNRKKKSKSVVGLDSNNDGNFVKEYKTKGKYLRQMLKSKESDEASETTSNDNSSSTSSLFISKQSGEISEVSSDTSFCSSLTKIPCSQSKNEKQTASHMCSYKVVQDQSRDFKTGLGRMVSSPKINSDSYCKNYDTPRRPIWSKVSWCRTSEPDLIEFSPVVNSGKQCQSVQSVATLSQTPEPDLISFSPEINQMHFKTNVNQRP